MMHLENLHYRFWQREVSLLLKQRRQEAQLPHESSVVSVTAVKLALKPLFGTG